MSRFIRKNRDEINKMSVVEFCTYMEEWDKATDEKWHTQKITESEMPQFKTKEEARKYYSAISFNEFEQEHLKKQKDSRPYKDVEFHSKTFS